MPSLNGKKICLFLCMIVGLFFLLCQSAAYANASAPPVAMWFIFDREMFQTLQIKGVQLVRCATEECAQFVLLKHDGTCYGSGCLPVASESSDGSFECAENKCRFVSYLPPYETVFFRLVVQFSDQVRISDMAYFTPPYSYVWQENAWNVTLQDTTLALARDLTFERPDKRYGRFLRWLAFTQGIELLTAGLLLRVWTKLPRKRLVGTLVIVFLVNLLSFPIVWFFFPSLAHFQPSSIRLLGVFSLVIVAFYSIMLAYVYKAGSEDRRRKILLLVFSLPLVLPCALFLYPEATYRSRSYGIPAAGLPSSIVLLLSEIFAVVFETVMIYKLCKGILSLRQVGITSFLMNLASFVLGIVFSYAVFNI